MMLRIALSLLVLLAQTQAPPPAPAPNLSPVADSPEGRALLNSVVRSYGGQDALAKVTSYRWLSQTIMLRIENGKAIEPTTNPAPGEVRIGSVTTIVLPDRWRFEFVRAKDNVKQHGMEIVSPEGAWMMLDNQIEPMPAKTQTQIRRSTEVSILTVLQQAGSRDYQFGAGGNERVGDRDYLALQISGPDDLRSKWLIDPTTGRIFRKIDTLPDASGTAYETITQYLAWNTVGNIVVPARWRTISRGAVSDAQCKYEINPTVNPDDFRKPSTQPASKPSK